MTIIQKLNNFFKKKIDFGVLTNSLKFKALNFYSLKVFTVVSIFTLSFFIILNFIEQKNLQDKNNFETLTSSNEFSNLTNYFISKLNSPYEEIKYSIKNNDSVEKILKQFKIRDSDIKDISVQLKQKKLTNIYTGRKLNLIIKKQADGSNTIVNLVYPLNKFF